MMRLLARLAVLCALAGLWAVVAAESHSLYLPSLGAIFTAFRQRWLFAHLDSDALATLSRFGVGLSCSTVLGVLGGLLLGEHPILRRALEPALEFLRATPAPVLLPVVMVLPGVGFNAKEVVIVAGSIWPILMNTTDAIANLDAVLLDTVSSYGVRGPRRVLRVILPAAAPAIAVGFRTAVSIALILTVVSEMVVSTNGIGYLLLQDQGSFDMPAMWADVVFLGLIGYLLNEILYALERLMPASTGLIVGDGDNESASSTLRGSKAARVSPRATHLPVRVGEQQAGEGQA